MRGGAEFARDERGRYDGDRASRRGSGPWAGRGWADGVGGAHRAPPGSRAASRRAAVRVLRPGAHRGLSGSGDVAGAAAGSGRRGGGRSVPRWPRRPGSRAGTWVRGMTGHGTWHPAGVTGRAVLPRAGIPAWLSWGGLPGPGQDPAQDPGQDPGQAGLAAPGFIPGGAFPPVLLAPQALVETLQGGRVDGPYGPGGGLPAVPRLPDVPLWEPLADVGERPKRLRLRRLLLRAAAVHWPSPAGASASPGAIASAAAAASAAGAIRSAHGHQNHSASAMTVSASIVAAGLMTANQGGRPSGTVSRAS